MKHLLEYFGCVLCACGGIVLMGCSSSETRLPAQHVSVFLQSLPEQRERLGLSIVLSNSGATTLEFLETDFPWHITSQRVEFELFSSNSVSRVSVAKNSGLILDTMVGLPVKIGAGDTRSNVIYLDTYYEGLEAIASDHTLLLQWQYTPRLLSGEELATVQGLVVFPRFKSE
jgi:hypothetical protein